MLWLSEFKLYMLLLPTTNNRSDSMYCEKNSNFLGFQISARISVLAPCDNSDYSI
jgi:hypothetical protein